MGEAAAGRVRRFREAVRSGFWAIPSLCVVLAVALAVLLVRVDRELQEEALGSYTFGAGPEGARGMLSAITSSMITFTGLVFSITIVVLTLTSSQFSPRVLRTFLRDRVTQVSLGIYTATFTYSVLVLRTVRASDENGTGEFVPAVATTVGIGLLLLSVAMFVVYIHHISTSIQVSSIITSIGAETRELIDRRVPTGQGGAPLTARPDAPAALEVPARRPGVVTGIDVTSLTRLAQEAGVLVVSELRRGDFVPEGAPLCAVVGDPAALDVSAVRRAFTLSRERTMQEDLAFGFRQLVDIGEKALSPGINDPTTAVQVLDELHDLLRRLAVRPMPDGQHRGADGALRVLLPAESFADFLDLALDEIEQYGAQSLQVQQKVRALLRDLLTAARPEHCPALEARLARDG